MKTSKASARQECLKARRWIQCNQGLILSALEIVFQSQADVGLNLELWSCSASTRQGERQQSEGGCQDFHCLPSSESFLTKTWQSCDELVGRPPATFDQ